MGIIYINIECMFKVVSVIIINSDSIMPSKHSSDDIK